ncbi:MAG: sialidase family protein [Chitinophagales bacterium]
MKNLILIVCAFLLTSIAYAQNKEGNDLVIANGQMPNMTMDKSNTIHIVYGNGDSILYISSKDGISFTSPALIAILPKLSAAAMRGPQIAAAANGLVVTACTNTGNIYSYKKMASGQWSKAMRVNDVNETAKEALMALSADGLNVYAIWLGVKNPKGQNVYGAKSIDGGKTWTKNMLVYANPEGTVCECCKPSVALRGDNVYVMFRNFLNGNRDLYLIKSADGGKSFGQAKKLGSGSWKLNGCPMDGGDLVINESGSPETVWRREGKIYAASLDMPEREIGEGHSCSMTTVNNKNIYAWSEKGNVVVMKPNGMKMNLGSGNLPLVETLNNEHVICVWEKGKRILTSVIRL